MAPHLSSLLDIRGSLRGIDGKNYHQRPSRAILRAERIAVTAPKGPIAARHAGKKMSALPEDELSKAEGVDAELTLALDSASKFYGFDPKNRRERQSGVESLQKALVGEGFDVVPDGILGRQTLAALERSNTDSQTSDTPRDEPSLKAESGSYTMKGGEAKLGDSSSAPNSDGTSSSQDRHDQQNTEEEFEDEPGVTPEEGDEGYDPALHGEEEEEEEKTVAQPIALSDSAVRDVDQDQLGFKPYVEAVADFILAEQTLPPLTIAINAPWGRGKTSFMNMIDTQLRREAKQATVKVATTWFNPWKYSEPDQVWGAFVANVTRCLRANLTPLESWRFRFDRFRRKLARHWDFALAIRTLVAFAFLAVVGALAVMDWTKVQAVVAKEHKLFDAFYEATSTLPGGVFWYIPFALAGLLGLVYLYVTFTKKLGLNLLEYVEKTDFRDKIGTLSQFEHEMRRLGDAMPDNLKVVVFIDDLDRCNGRVLGEIIEALQLADVSRCCIFVMGMDLEIVANAIENERKELAHSVGTETTRMEHGSGYKFLEKIIQTRLSLPTYGPEEMQALVTSAMAGQRKLPAQSAKPPKDGKPDGEGEERRTSKPDGLLESTLQSLKNLGRRHLEIHSDSDDVIATAQHYGSRHFRNPRRLKRFINGFRLQTYLTTSVRPGSISNERLARFLVLAEKWPALVDYMISSGSGANFWKDEDTGKSTTSIAREVNDLSEDERARLTELLEGRRSTDPLQSQDLKDLADWYGFCYYPGIQMKRRGL